MHSMARVQKKHPELSQKIVKNVLELDSGDGLQNAASTRNYKNV